MTNKSCPTTCKYTANKSRTVYYYYCINYTSSKMITMIAIASTLTTLPCMY